MLCPVPCQILLIAGTRQPDTWMESKQKSSSSCAIPSRAFAHVVRPSLSVSPVSITVVVTPVAGLSRPEARKQLHGPVTRAAEGRVPHTRHRQVDIIGLTKSATMPPRQRLVRKRPLLERVRGALNPSDFLLWASEEIKTRDLDAKPVGTRLAVTFNFVFLLARANYGATTTGDDVFSEARFSWVTLFVSSSVPWYLITSPSTQANTYRVLTWPFSPPQQAKQLVWLLTIVSIANAVAVFYQKRHYRLFEANVEQGPGTPSAQRVRVQSSPMSSSPLRLLTNVLGSDTAESRAHPDRTRDVWEIAVWDPVPACLQGVVYFSPVHVLMYVFELPLDPLDRRPSVTLFKCLVLQVCLSWMLQTLQSTNDQRQKDSAIIQKEVFREYDTKFVHPRLHPLVRDVGTQASVDDNEHEEDVVEFGTPTTILRRGFQTHPNPNYLKHIDPDSTGRSVQTTNLMTPRLFTPATRNRQSDAFAASQQSAQPRPRKSMPAVVHSPMVSALTSTSTQPQPVPNAPSPVTAAGSSSTGTNFGGSLGVYTHANSPLKKATSLGEINGAGGFGSPRNSREMASLEQQQALDRQRVGRAASPLKQQFSRHESAAEDSAMSSNPFAAGMSASNPFAKNRPNRHTMERYPSRW